MPKALIAMSGGVDSAVAALLTAEQGYTCEGVTIQMFADDAVAAASNRPCGASKDIEDARRVADRLGIAHRVFDFSADFEQHVVRRFVDTYAHGGTPNPCIDCNRHIKFERLWNTARDLGFDCIVTGHYARIRFDEQTGRYQLLRAVDQTKDQSYVLYNMTQEQLAHTLFPLGEYTKAHARELAAAHGFVNADKQDSQDICFVPDGDYAAFIERYTGKPMQAGNFVDENGKVLGRHRGVMCYTVGQRKGLGLSLPAPLYVCRKCVEDNTVVLGPHERLFTRDLDATAVNWIAFDTPPAQPVRVKAKVRYKQAEQWATVTATGPDTMHVTFDEPQRAIAAGQAVVLYDGDAVVGGGTIL